MLACASLQSGDGNSGCRRSHAHPRRSPLRPDDHVREQPGHPAFWVEVALPAVIGLKLLIRLSRLWWTAMLLVAASAFGAVLLYHHVAVGTIGPSPNT
jgi:hypothetical protein